MNNRMAHEKTVLRIGDILSKDRAARTLELKRQNENDDEMAHKLSVQTPQEVVDMVETINVADPGERSKFRQQLHRIFTSLDIPKTPELNIVIFTINSALKPDEDME